MKTLKNTLSLLLCLLLLATPVICSAATVSSTEEEIRSLLTISLEWKQINETLQLNSSDLQKKHVATLQELNAVRQELDALKLSHEKRLKSEQEAIALSGAQQSLISKTNVLFEKYSKEMKSKVHRLETENTILKIVIGAGTAYLAGKAAGIIK